MDKKWKLPNIADADHAKKDAVMSLIKVNGELSRNLVECLDMLEETKTYCEGLVGFMKMSQHDQSFYTQLCTILNKHK